MMSSQCDLFILVTEQAPQAYHLAVGFTDRKEVLGIQQVDEDRGTEEEGVHHQLYKHVTITLTNAVVDPTI